ncbi:hypothetical protein BDR07DRAFT_1288989 [Suillus spraguei]|nr:hypothetical protein BDR07DRAFT_1288989 [Suillus spraguei]
MHGTWSQQIVDLVDAYLIWKNGAMPPDEASSMLHSESNDDDSHFQVMTVTLSKLSSSCSFHQRMNEGANTSLIRHGFLSCSPLQPTVAISLNCLEVHHQIRHHKVSFSVQAMTKVICALHNCTYFQTFRDQFAIAFDVYLRILSHVQSCVDHALGCDTADWCMLNSCPVCHFKVCPLVYPAHLASIDGNNSLKHIDGSGHADEHIFESSYLIPPEEVEKIKDDVWLQPGTHIGPDPTPTTASDESKCTENWKTANTVSENTVKVFDQTGIFISACRHGILQTLVEMRKSGEL